MTQRIIFISNALAQKYRSSDEQFGSKYVELAETAAVGRALSDAGFGLRFADMEEDFDSEVSVHRTADYAWWKYDTTGNLHRGRTDK